MAYKLDTQQKEDFRRLTQKANRRLIKAMNEYESAGLKVIPKQLSGGFAQTRQQWASTKYPLSRATTQFRTKKDYQSYMKKLRQFDIPEAKGGVPTYTQFRNVQAMKIKHAMKTAFDGGVYRNIPDDIQKALESRIEQMEPAEMTAFWKKFELQGKKLVDDFTSDAAMQKVMDEIFMKEDLKPMIIDAIVEAEGVPTKKELKAMKMTKDQYLRGRRTTLKYYGNQKLIDYLNQKRGE